MTLAKLLSIPGSSLGFTGWRCDAVANRRILGFAGGRRREKLLCRCGAAISLALFASPVIALTSLEGREERQWQIGAPALQGDQASPGGVAASVGKFIEERGLCETFVTSSE